MKLIAMIDTKIDEFISNRIINLVLTGIKIS